MADLDNLFNSPPGPPPRRSLPPDSPPTPIAGPSRSANPLFFSPGSIIDSPRRGGPAPTQRRARSPIPDPTDLEEEPDNYRPRPATGPGAREGSAFGSPVPDDVLDPFAGLRNVDDDGEGAPKKRRVMAKVDGDRLMGDDGITKLMKAAKKFKVKGKGREAEDLKDLLNVYQLWAHGMFPKGDFMGTMNRVEVVCRTRRMESAMKGYRDSFYPRARTPTPPPRQSRSRSRSRSRSVTVQLQSKSPTRGASPDATTSFNFEPAASGAEPLFSERDERDMEDEDDGPDLDELLAMEEMESGLEASGPAASAAPVVAGGAQAQPEEEDWDDVYD